MINLRESQKPKSQLFNLFSRVLLYPKVQSLIHSLRSCAVAWSTRFSVFYWVELDNIERRLCYTRESEYETFFFIFQIDLIFNPSPVYETRISSRNARGDRLGYKYEHHFLSLEKSCPCLTCPYLLLRFVYEITYTYHIFNDMNDTSSKYSFSFDILKAALKR